MYEIEIDEGIAVIHARFQGLLTIEMVERYNAELQGFVARAQERFGVVNLITDTIQAPVQKTGVVERFTPPGEILRGPADKYAAVVSSTLAKLQGERVLAGDPRTRVFLTLAEAQDWMRA